MPFRTRRALAVFALATAAVAARAEEYDVTVVFKDDTPVMVPFFKCLRNAMVAATDETLPVCKERERERDRDRTFNAPAARITNLGTSVIWVHLGAAKLPVPPGKFYRRTMAGGATFDHVFISGAPDGVAHVFASSSGADEPEAPAPKPSR